MSQYIIGDLGGAPFISPPRLLTCSRAFIVLSSFPTLGWLRGAYILELKPIREEIWPSSIAMASPAAPGLLFCFAAMVLLIFVSVSAPTWDAISFMTVVFGGQRIQFGVFGYTGSQVHIGYTFPAVLNQANVHTSTIYNATRALILHPIAGGLSALAILFGLCGAGGSRAGTVFMSLTSVLAFLVTLIAWVIDMVLFGIARNRIRSAGGLAQYGNATWMTLGALISLAFGFCFGFFGIFGRYQRRRGKF